MRNKVVSCSLVVALLAPALATAAFPEERSEPARTASSVDLRASIDRSASQLATDARHASLLKTEYRETAATATQGGGGGGHAGMIVMTLVGVAASAGAGYFIYKEMKKQTNQVNK